VMAPALESPRSPSPLMPGPPSGVTPTSNEEHNARCKIMIDGVGRTNRDTREIAIEAAKVPKADNPNAARAE
jgi:hypothetical protein